MRGPSVTEMQARANDGQSLPQAAWRGALGGGAMGAIAQAPQPAWTADNLRPSYGEVLKDQASAVGQGFVSGVHTLNTLRNRIMKSLRGSPVQPAPHPVINGDLPPPSAAPQEHFGPKPGEVDTIMAVRG